MSAPTCVVTDAHGRRWTVHRRLNWRAPATVNDFDHDVQTGSLAAFVLLGLVVTFVVGIMVAMPADRFASKIVFGLALFLLFFPTRWAWRRPWTIVAERGDAPDEVERWVGTVRGVLAARRELERTVRALEENSEPAYEGRLSPVS